MIGSEESARPTFRKMLITGLLFVIPLGVTYWLLDALVNQMEAISRPLVVWIVSVSIDPAITVPAWAVTLLSILLVMLGLLSIGWLANFYIGKKLLNLVDQTMLRVPFVRGIYGGAKQIMDAFSLPGGGSFKKVVMLEYPRRGCWALAFVTNESVEKAKGLYGRDLVGVFLPSTPNPTTGFLLYLQPEELYVVDLAVDEAVKLIVSAGLVIPDQVRKPIETLADEMARNQTDADENARTKT